MKQLIHKQSRVDWPARAGQVLVRINQPWLTRYNPPTSP